MSESFVLLEVHAEFTVPFRPTFKRLTGSTNAAILLQQIVFHWKKSRGIFYKFNGPCGHEDYVRGDSWEEELAFSLDELASALGRIATKITKGTSKTEARAKTDLTGAVLYWTDSSRKTWYEVNAPLLNRLLGEAYRALGKPVIPDHLEDGKAIALGRQEKPDYLVTRQSPITPETETRTERREEEIMSPAGTSDGLRPSSGASSSESDVEVPKDEPALKAPPRKRIPTSDGGRLVEGSAPASYEVWEELAGVWGYFVRWYNTLYQRKEAPKGAWKSFRRQFGHLKGQKLTSALSGLKAATLAYNKKMAGKEMQFYRHPATFLNEDWSAHVAYEAPPTRKGINVRDEMEGRQIESKPSSTGGFTPPAKTAQELIADRRAALMAEE